jgi:hypothetical protein
MEEYYQTLIELSHLTSFFEGGKPQLAILVSVYSQPRKGAFGEISLAVDNIWTGFDERDTESEKKEYITKKIFSYLSGLKYIPRQKDLIEPIEYFKKNPRYEKTKWISDFLLNPMVDGIGGLFLPQGHDLRFELQDIPEEEDHYIFNVRSLNQRDPVLTPEVLSMDVYHEILAELLLFFRDSVPPMSMNYSIKSRSWQFPLPLED